jgi:hypothetical protein
VCPQERLVIISYTTGLSFALKRIGPLAAIIIIVFNLLVLYLLALSNTPVNPFASIYIECLIKTACQHLLLLVGFDTLIYRKYYDTPPILVGHHNPLCQLYDPVSAISFMRECISKPMNPGTLLIRRSNFPTTLSLFLFSVLIKFENIKILLFTTLANQNTTPPYFTVYHCIAYSRGTRLFLALLPLHIYLFALHISF